MTVRGVHPAVTSDVKVATGIVKMVITPVFVSVFEEPPSVTVKVTVYVPGLWYKCEGDVKVAVFAAPDAGSPKFHAKVAEPVVPVEVFVNATNWDPHPVVLSIEKFASNCDLA